MGLSLLMSNLFVSGILISYGFKIFTLSMTELNFYKTQYFCMKLLEKFFLSKTLSSKKLYTLEVFTFLQYVSNNLHGIQLFTF